MSFSKSFKEVLKEAKEAFKDIQRTEYEKYHVHNLKPCLREVGFIDGMKQIVCYK
ncbi:MAG: hypothetical protein QM497_04790 [Sulfurimonas sp.]